MLRGYHNKRPGKETLPAQPFIDNSSQCILIAGWTCSALQLFRRHISHSARNSLELVAGTLDNYCQPKITQQDCILVP